MSGIIQATNLQVTNVKKLDGSAPTLNDLSISHAGSVVQVVQGSHNSIVSISTATYTFTGLSATITPKFSSSKILVQVEQQGCASTLMSTGAFNMRLQRDSSDIHNFAIAYWYSPQANGFRGPISTSYLDSPSTTSATVYRTMFGVNGGGTCSVQNDSANSVSTITLMEIKQ